MPFSPYDAQLYEFLDTGKQANTRTRILISYIIDKE
jgi:hypothetical protein